MWISPTGDVDPDNEWEARGESRDRNIETCASCHGPAEPGEGIWPESWGGWLHFTLDKAIMVKNVKIYAEYSDSYIEEVQIQAGFAPDYDDYSICTSTFTDKTWLYKPLPDGPQIIEGLKIRFHNVNEEDMWPAYLYEVMVNHVASRPKIGASLASSRKGLVS